MPSITINGVRAEFTPGQTILQAANAVGAAIPQYCYHEGLSIVASCRICLAEVWAPNAKTGVVEPYMGGKLLPTCQTTASEGMVVYSDGPKSVANQKAVMEYLLINHPLDCPVCDQSGECFLQDYSYQYGRSVSRFEEQKVKQPKKDLGPHVYLYSDRCIMCTRCVRFTREVTGTAELFVQGRGNKEEIDVFPGIALDNELSGNVVDLCPVGALLDKDFLFTQRVWFLRETPGIDPLTASGDNIEIHHNEGRIHRVKPRTNMAVNRWWITDEVRYGWKFVHSEARLRSPSRRQYGTRVSCEFERAYDDAVAGVAAAVGAGKRLLLVVSPMLTCEEAWLLGRMAKAMDAGALLAVGPVPTVGEDRTFPPGDPAGFKAYAEKVPNARGVRRVLSALGEVIDFDAAVGAMGRDGGRGEVGAIILTGNYPSEWATAALERALGGAFTVLIDTLESGLCERVDVVLPGASFAEKAGTFENARGMLQAFEQAIPVIEMAKTEGQIALDLMSVLEGRPDPVRDAAAVVVQTTVGQVAAGAQVTLARGRVFNAADVRAEMARAKEALGVMATGVTTPAPLARQVAEMEMVEL